MNILKEDEGNTLETKGSLDIPDKSIAPAVEKGYNVYLSSLSLCLNNMTTFDPRGKRIFSSNL